MEVKPDQRGAFWLVMACFALVVLGALGLVGVVLYGADLGGDVLNEDVQAALNDNAIVREHLGRVVAVDVRWLESSVHPHPEVFVFDVEGERAEGVVKALILTVEDGEELVEGLLELSSGEVVELVPETAGDTLGSG